MNRTEKVLKTKRKPKTNSSRIPNALILNKSQLNEVELCVEKFLTDILRPHQRDGLLFMYECVMGIKNGDQHRGLILGDEMGLGKTLQTIALIYTLIRDSPYAHQSQTLNKVLIVTPSSLVGNWKKEWNKWILPQRMCSSILLSTDNKMKQQSIISIFTAQHSSNPVLIIGYEMLRSNVSEISKANIDMIVCDEGHRLKNQNGNQTIDALLTIAKKCRRRVLLTGTPIQNNLSELYAVCNFVNPGILGDFTWFKREFKDKIEFSRNSECSAYDKQMGDKSAMQLNMLTNQFILRRTAEQVMGKYLKPKDEYIIFHQLSDIQQRLYLFICESKTVQKCIMNGKGSAQALQCILYLRFCCNCPLLTISKMYQNEAFTVPRALKCEIQSMHESMSEKMKLLHQMLVGIHKLDDRVVIVSNFTSILDIVEQLLNKIELTFLRLDGSVSVGKRTALVSNFNHNYSGSFAFLLSAKAGGVGLNLIGANHLILLEPDWNPATDAQAMARIWRDGQSKRCKIYRFIAIGTIEEKILQRQFSKLEISDCVMDRNGRARFNHKERNFNALDLKRIFQLKTDSEYCETMDILRNERVKEWKILNIKCLVKPIVFSVGDGYDCEIPVIFTRSVDPKNDTTYDWDIKQKNDESDEDDGKEDESKEDESESVYDSLMDRFAFKGNEENGNEKDNESEDGNESEDDSESEDETIEEMEKKMMGSTAEFESLFNIS